MKAGFLFDLDGVLIDTEGQYSQIWSKINREFPSGVENLEKVIKGTTLSKIIKDYYPDQQKGRQVTERLHELENEMKFEYLPHAYNFLLSQKKEGRPMVLVTSSDNKKMELLFKQLPELKNFFNFIITGDQVKKSKPDPEGYLLAANKLNLKPEHCYVFEDSLQGVIAGQKAGCKVIGVKGTVDEGKLLPYCNFIIDYLNDDLLKEI